MNATHCREFLGWGKGYCPAPIHTTDEYGTGFCADHAEQRGIK